MKKVVTIYYGDDWGNEIPFPNNNPTRISFEDWNNRGLKNGIEMYRASIKWYDAEKNLFKKAWAYRDNEWKKITEPIQPDLIFDRVSGKHDYELFDMKMSAIAKTGAKFFNHPIFRIAMYNKFTQYLVLQEFMPKSFLATDKDEFKEVIDKIKTQKIVIKPLYGSGGAGIIIDEKENVKKDFLDYPVFVQEFVKSEKGIPGFSKKNEVSDLRIIYMNHKIVYALSRIAKEGSLFTNFHQGASAVFVPENKIPKSVKKMANEIVGRLSIFPKANYSLDFVFSNDEKPILIEMNTTPGFDLLHIVGDEETKEKNLKEFINILK